MKKTQDTARLERNRIVIDEWLENKVYEISALSFSKIKTSIRGQNFRYLQEDEKFIRNMVVAYKRIYGEWPIAFRADLSI